MTVSTLVIPMLASMSLGGAPVALPRQLTATGETKVVLQRAYDRLCSPPLGDLDFVLSDVNFKLKRRFTEYSGDVSGRMLGALVWAGPVLGQDSAMVGQIVGELGKLQKTDGHFGVDQNLEAGLDPQRDMPILWGNSRLLLALVQRYQQTKDAESLKIARGIGDYVVATRKYFGKPENLKLGGSYAAGYTTCYPSLIEGMALLAEATGENRYLDEARHIAGIALQDTSFEKHHSHGRLASYRGMLEIDRIAGRPEFLPAVRAGCEKVTKDLVLPTGGVTEVFDRTDTRDEGCSEVDWIMANVLLWRATGETRWLDMADFALRNHLLATQFPNGGFGHHSLRTLQAGDKSWLAGGFANVGAEAYWCCSKHGTQCLADLARWGVVSDGKNIAVTWLAEVRASVPRENGAVTVTASRDGLNAWKVQLQARSAEIPLRLRAPAWAKALVVDGKSIEARDGWVEVTCPVKDSAALTVEFPKDIRLLGPYRDKRGEGEPCRVIAGADLYCLSDAYLPKDFLADGAVPEILVAAKECGEEGIPVVVRGRRTGSEVIRTRLVPMAGRPAGGCRYFFNVHQARDSELANAREYVPSGEPIELVFACDGTCELYLNGSIGSRAGWGESSRQEVYAKKGSNTLHIKMHSKSARPGLIGAINTRGGQHVTSARGWETAACPADTSPAASDWNGLHWDSGKLQDLGGFGAEPWKHMPAEFAGTDARWIWPQEAAGQGDNTWLVRYTFQIE